MTTAPAVSRTAGPFAHLFDPNTGRAAGAAYTHDLWLIRDAQGRWHTTGIVGTRPVDTADVARTLFHASGSDLTSGGWLEHEHAPEADPARSERVLWAPHVVLGDGVYRTVYTPAQGPKALS